MTVHICGEELTEVWREPYGVKWCFRCRKRVEFVHIVQAPVAMSYYGPNSQIECTACGMRDSDLFPGIEREWE